MIEYSPNETIDIIKNNIPLLNVNTGNNEYLIKYEDIADFIVYYNENIEMTNMKISEWQNANKGYIATTIGMFLDKCDKDFRAKIIDRLIALQMGDLETKEIKYLKPDIYYYLFCEMEQKKLENKEQKKIIFNNKEISININSFPNGRLALYGISEYDDLYFISENLPDIEMKDMSYGFITSDCKDVGLEKKLLDEGIIKKIIKKVKYNMGTYDLVQFDLKKLDDYDHVGLSFVYNVNQPNIAKEFKI